MIPTTSARLKVLPAKIGEELDRIRREAAALDMKRESEASGSAAPRVKATLSNVILLTPGPTTGKWINSIDDIISQICVAYPSRFFVVEYHSDNEEPRSGDILPIEAAVSSRCVRSGTGLHVCSEEVYLSVGPSATDGIRNLVLSLLIPDVPTILVLTCDPAQKELTGEDDSFGRLLCCLAALTSMVIYDSQLFDDYAASMHRLTECDWFRAGSSAASCALTRLEHLPESCSEFRATSSRKSSIRRLVRRSLGEGGSFSGGGSDNSCYTKQEGALEARLDCDLNWLRIEGWRQILAEQFRSHAESDRSWISRVRIEFCSSGKAPLLEHVPASAVLLGAWFASLLNWRLLDKTLSEETAVLAFCNSCGHQTAIEFVAETSGESPSVAGELRAIEVGTVDERHERVVRIQCQERGQFMIKCGCAAYPDCECYDRKVFHSLLAFEDLLVKALRRQERDVDFERVLAKSLEAASRSC